MDLTQEDIQEILRYLEHSSFDEFYLETPHLKLIVRRGSGSQVPVKEPLAHVPAAARPSEEPSTASPPAGARSEDDGEAARPVERGDAHRVESSGDQLTASAADAVLDGRVPIAAPLRGIFYRAPRPGAEPFVDTGSQVEPDTVVGIIEVMKLMHSITAGIRGTIISRCVEDGEAVEEGQPLFWVRPASMRDGE